MSLSRFIPLVLLAALIGILVCWNRHPAPPASMASHGHAALPAMGHTNCPAAKTQLPDVVPPEACVTLTAILQGGPFPYAQDGAVFGNEAGLLPQQPRGYYHAYTLPASDARHRGTRRIVTGGTPPVAFYYTDDRDHRFKPLPVSR